MENGLEFNTRTRQYVFQFHDKELENWFSAKKTVAGYTVVTMEGECFPHRRDPAWHAQQEAVMGTRAYRREHKLDWTTSDGDVYYPEFANSPYKFIDPQLSFQKSLPVYRGWDFGFRRPACVWFQVVDGRLCLLRECMPENISSHAWAKLVLYLSGQVEKAELEKYPRALTWAMKLEEMDASRMKDKEYPFPKPPWFPAGTRFIDFAGPECYAVSRQIEQEDEARNDYEILANYGIVLGVLSARIAARTAIIRRLLVPPGGGTRLSVSVHCRDLVAGLSGGIAYKKGTEMDPEPNTPSKDGYYEHLHDALSYGVVNLFSVTEEADAPPPPGPVREHREQDSLTGYDGVAFADEGVFVDPADEW